MLILEFKISLKLPYLDVLRKANKWMNTEKELIFIYLSSFHWQGETGSTGPSGPRGPMGELVSFYSFLENPSFLSLDEPDRVTALKKNHMMYISNWNWIISSYKENDRL